MPAPVQVKVYKLDFGYCAFGVIGGGILAVKGIISLAAYQETREPGIVIGLLTILIGALIIASAVTTSVTIHEQGVVIRQKLRRRFIPWQAVK